MSFYWTKFGAIGMPNLPFIETCMTENSCVPCMRLNGFKIVWHVFDTHEMCNCFVLSC